MTEPADLRAAMPDDAAALAELEREANLVALGHVFPADEHPFPTAEVEERWRRVLGEPDVTVEVVDGMGGLLAFVAYDERRVAPSRGAPDSVGPRVGPGAGRAGRLEDGAAAEAVVPGRQPPRPVALRTPRLAEDRPVAAGRVAAVPVK